MPTRRDLAQRLGRDRQPVADAAGGLEHDVVGAADRDLAGDERDHRAATAARRRSGARLAWQTATASASAAWSGARRRGSASSAATIRVTWALAARPLPQTAPLTCCGV